MHVYRFHHAWVVRADADAVRRLVDDVAGYGAWWRSVRVLGGDLGSPSLASQGSRSGELEVRPPLGYRIRIRLEELPSASAAGAEDELRASVSGDLEGWCAWRLAPAPRGTAVFFDQEVVARALLLRLARPVRPLLQAQHAAVLRHAEAGMRRALER